MWLPMSQRGEGEGGVAWEIAPDVYCLGPWGRTQTNVYFVCSGSSWVLIDAGWASDGPRIERAGASLFGHGVRPAAILLTHCHPDHSGAALHLARAWGCAVYMHSDELPIATGDFAAMQAWAGQSAALARAEPAAVVVQRLWEDAQTLLR